MAMFVVFQREVSFWQKMCRAKDTFPATLLKANWSCMSPLPSTSLRDAAQVVLGRRVIPKRLSRFGDEADTNRITEYAP